MKWKKLKRSSPEKVIQNQILGFLRTIGVMCWTNDSVGIWDPKKQIYRKRQSAYHMRGVSDILGIIPYFDETQKATLGRFLAIEVKSEKGVISPEQRIFITQINENGGIAFVTRSLQNCIEQLLKFFPQNQKLQRFAKDYSASGGASH